MARCSADRGISIISRVFFAGVSVPSCSASARFLVLDREPEPPAAPPFVGRLSLLINV
jgi:hypothetical protein